MTDSFNPTSMEDYIRVSEEENTEQEVQEEPTQEPEVATEEPAPTQLTEEPVVQEEEQKQTQSAEDNARFAEQRRQKQIEERVQQELERVRQQAPEFQMAQMLSEYYGMPVNELFVQLQEAALQKQAEERGVPVDMMRQLSAYEQQQYQLQQQLNMMQFNNWQNRVEGEAKQLTQQYPMLSEQDIDEAKFYLLESLQNPEIPLQKAVFALHGEKIAENLKQSAKQEALAEISGRKRGGLPPQGTKSNDSTTTLSEEERYVARMMGLSEQDYLKWR